MSKKETRRQQAIARIRAERDLVEGPLMPLEEAYAIINKACKKGKREGSNLFNDRCISRSVYPYKL